MAELAATRPLSARSSAWGPAGAGPGGGEPGAVPSGPANFNTLSSAARLLYYGSAKPRQPRGGGSPRGRPASAPASKQGGTMHRTLPTAAPGSVVGGSLLSAAGGSASRRPASALSASTSALPSRSAATSAASAAASAHSGSHAFATRRRPASAYPALSTSAASTAGRSSPDQRGGGDGGMSESSSASPRAAGGAGGSAVGGVRYLGVAHPEAPRSLARRGSGPSNGILLRDPVGPQLAAPRRAFMPQQTVRSDVGTSFRSVAPQHQPQLQPYGAGGDEGTGGREDVAALAADAEAGAGAASPHGSGSRPSEEEVANLARMRHGALASARKALWEQIADSAGLEPEHLLGGRSGGDGDGVSSEEIAGGDGGGGGGGASSRGAILAAASLGVAPAVVAAPAHGTIAAVLMARQRSAGQAAATAGQAAVATAAASPLPNPFAVARGGSHTALAEQPSLAGAAAATAAAATGSGLLRSALSADAVPSLASQVLLSSQLSSGAGTFSGSGGGGTAGGAAATAAGAAQPRSRSRSTSLGTAVRLCANPSLQASLGVPQPQGQLSSLPPPPTQQLQQQQAEEAAAEAASDEAAQGQGDAAAYSGPKRVQWGSAVRAPRQAGSEPQRERHSAAATPPPPQQSPFGSSFGVAEAALRSAAGAHLRPPRYPSAGGSGSPPARSSLLVDSARGRSGEEGEERGPAGPVGDGPGGTGAVAAGPESQSPHQASTEQATAPDAGAAGGGAASSAGGEVVLSQSLPSPSPSPRDAEYYHLAARVESREDVQGWLFNVYVTDITPGSSVARRCCIASCTTADELGQLLVPQPSSRQLSAGGDTGPPPPSEAPSLMATAQREQPPAPDALALAARRHPGRRRPQVLVSEQAGVKLGPVISPADLLPWVARPEQLQGHWLRLEAFAIAPMAEKVLDTMAHMGDPGLEQPPEKHQPKLSRLQVVETRGSPAASVGGGAGGGRGGGAAGGGAGSGEIGAIAAAALLGLRPAGKAGAPFVRASGQGLGLGPTGGAAAGGGSVWGRRRS
ncbi:hypothetical protein GPECTOR_34g759 [Gonium pectorale]|uniref:Uncharacterized protein n=1 Tax=Gonium pectorale TaxID=33097 RepID=A0A150GE24_GONPE|nr:hypothetical protein GPECTOR_34g759 [Gonium pectorale]|eukprot:KXZ47600.1 hypothetical protein GPECTOR_34g759 [Gonium pectorale]